MSPTKEECIDIILLAGSCSIRQITSTFIAEPRTEIIRDAETKLIEKFKSTRFATAARRFGKPKMETDEDTSTQVPAAMARSTTEGDWRLSKQI